MIEIQLFLNDMVLSLQYKMVNKVENIYHYISGAKGREIEEGGVEKGCLFQESI